VLEHQVWHSHAFLQNFLQRGSSVLLATLVAPAVVPGLALWNLMMVAVCSSCTSSGASNSGGAQLRLGKEAAPPFSFECFLHHEAQPGGSCLEDMMAIFFPVSKGRSRPLELAVQRLIWHSSSFGFSIALCLAQPKPVPLWWHGDRGMVQKDGTWE
jgi:hypothetical protein